MRVRQSRLADRNVIITISINRDASVSVILSDVFVLAPLVVFGPAVHVDRVRYEHGDFDRVVDVVRGTCFSAGYGTVFSTGTWTGYGRSTGTLTGTGTFFCTGYGISFSARTGYGCGAVLVTTSAVLAVRRGPVVFGRGTRG